jgi:hypothetical protein
MGLIEIKESYIVDIKNLETTDFIGVLDKVIIEWE